MALEISNNNLILKAASEKPAQAPSISTPVIPESKPDTFEKKTNTRKSDAMALVANIALLAGLFLLPDVLMYKFGKKSITNLFNSIKNFKPAIGENITRQTQTTLKNGDVRVLLENSMDRIKDKEIIILRNGKAIRRIITRQEKMPNGKYILRRMKSYQSNKTNLLDNAEIDKNEGKYLVKSFIRKLVGDKEYQVKVKNQGKPDKISKYHCTRNGQPVLRITENNEYKENTAFLFDGDRCIGADRQIIPKKDGEKQYNILSIPQQGIYNKKYNLETDGPQYQQSLMKKLLDNF